MNFYKDYKICYHEFWKLGQEMKDNLPILLKKLGE